jgi:hypothetical protein
MKELIALYRSLLDADLPRWQAEVGPLRRRLVESGATYGERELLRVLRPKLLGSGDYLYLDYVSGVIMGALRRLAARAVDDPGLLDFLGVSAEERRLLAPEPLCPDPVAFARLDAFMTAEGFRVVEANVECPAGPGYADRTLEEMLGLALVQEFQRRTGAYPIPTREGFLRGLLMAWHAAGRRGRPRVLITDYLDLPTAPEFHMLADYLRAHGFEAVVEDPRRLEYRAGALVAQGTTIDLVYRRVLVNEFLERADEVRPLFEAYRDRAVVMVNPFRAKLAHKKTSFALLSGDHLDPQWLTPEERRVVDRHVPWTRRLRPGRTVYRGAVVDLVELVASRRQDFVLKPNDDYGGRGIVLGWEGDDAGFQRSLEAALDRDYVVQERIRTVEEPFPVLDRDLADQPMVVDLDPYVYLGRVHGVLARLSAGALCNVTSGGGQVPVLFLPE